MIKDIWPAPWITKGSRITMPPKDRGPYLTAVGRVLIMPALVSLNFTIGCMICFQSYLFIIISDKGYFIVWGFVEFKTFCASFCLTPPDLIEVSQTVDFLCMYISWSSLFPSGAMYIPNMTIASFAWRYWSGNFYLVLLVASIILSCPGFVHFSFSLSPFVIN